MEWIRPSCHADIMPSSHIRRPPSCKPVACSLWPKRERKQATSSCPWPNRLKCFFGLLLPPRWPFFFLFLYLFASLLMGPPLSGRPHRTILSCFGTVECCLDLPLGGVIKAFLLLLFFFIGMMKTTLLSGSGTSFISIQLGLCKTWA